MYEVHLRPAVNRRVCKTPCIWRWLKICYKIFDFYLGLLHMF